MWSMAASHYVICLCNDISLPFSKCRDFLEACMEYVVQGFHAALSILSLALLGLRSSHPILSTMSCVWRGTLVATIRRVMVHELESNMIDEDQETSPRPGAKRPPKSRLGGLCSQQPRLAISLFFLLAFWPPTGPRFM